MKNKIPPPIIFLITASIMWLVSRSALAYPVPVPFSLMLFLVLAAFGFLIAFSALRQFNAVETTVNPLTPDEASSLVDTGIFGRTRNPMYLGLLLICVGWGLWLGSLSNVVTIVVFVLVITELQIKPEEAALEKLFGSQYVEYCRRVRRWI